MDGDIQVLGGLTPQQHAAAIQPGAVLVLAGAGTGKTKTLSHAVGQPSSLAPSKADQSAHMIAVVLDQEAITSGAVRDGAPWKHYDLGHSYCSNAFWSTFPHRMACAGCFFNVPKQSAKGLILAAQQSAGCLLEEVWLSPDERAAVEGDVAALSGMLGKLQDVPALDGRTPREIGGDTAPSAQ